MGGITTINRKRNDDYGNASQQFPNKKPRFSSATPRVSYNNISTSVADRIRRYPEPVDKLNRPVHAPCSSSSRIRDRLLGFHNNRKEEEERMGNLFSHFVKRLSWGRSSNTSNYNGYKSLSDKVVVENGVVDLGDDDDGVAEVVVHGDGEMMEVDDGELKHPSSSSVVSEDLGDGRKLKVEEDKVGRVLDVVSVVSRERDVQSGVPAYKKLKDGIDKKYGRLRILSWEIDLNWKRLAISRLYRPAKKEKDVVKEPFVPLTKEEAFEVTSALSNAKRRKVLVTHENSNIEITGELLQCLRPGAWLNDEVINVYLELLKEREKRDPRKYLKCHFFNTFFYKKLMGGRSGYDFKSVQRWTTQKKLGYCLLECDKIFVPIHKEVHWCLAVINKKDKKFQYLDSLRGSDNQVMKELAQYFVDEVKDKSGEDIDVSTWKQECVKDLPKQENGFDCGVFMIKYCDFYSRDVGLCFDQGNMPYFRQRTAKEILRLKAD